MGVDVDRAHAPVMAATRSVEWRRRMTDIVYTLAPRKALCRTGSFQLLDAEHAEKRSAQEAQNSSHATGPDGAFFGTAARDASTGVPSGCPQDNPGAWREEL